MPLTPAPTTGSVRDPEPRRLGPGAEHLRTLMSGAQVAAGAETFTVTGPMTGEPLVQLPLSTTQDVERAFARAWAAQRGWSAVPVRRRARVLLRFHDLVLTHRDELLDVIQLESGKARSHALEEVADIAILARHYGVRGPRYLREQRHRGAIPLLSRTVEAHLPKGVVGVVTPWNYPLALAIGDTIPALVAGNAVVLRPDPQGSLTALTAARLLTEAGLPEGILQVVLGHGRPVAEAVLDRSDYVCYTGSTPTGRLVAERAARRLVGASLELGGKNGLYVRADADLERTVEGALRACYSSAGQLCVSTERLLVHTDVYDRFVARFADAVAGASLGTGLTWGYQVGSLASATQLARVTEHVHDAVAKGAVVLAGGHHRPDVGPFVFEPTLLSGVTAAMACRDDETFGPVVAVYRVRDDDEAVRLLNDTPYGLNASIWTRDTRTGRRIAARVRAGIVNINEGYAAAWGSVAAPMGGMGDSGLGRRHGRDGILKYTESQNVTVQRLVGFGGLPGMSDRRFADLLVRALWVLRRLRLS